MKVLAYTRSRAVARGFVTVCAAVFVTSAASTAHAAGVVGTGTSASCSDAALDTALASGGLVTFNCGGPATIDISTGTGIKTIAADTTVDGGGLITISGGNSVRVFTVNTGVTFTVQYLTISNGNSTGSPGGGIDNEGGTLMVTDTTFSGNGALPGPGGGIFNTGTLTVTNSTFSGNRAGVGGGIGNIGTGTLTVTNSTFSGNSAGIGGGGIANGTGTLTVTNSTFSGNSAPEAGGGIVNLGTLTVTNSTFSGNSADEVGGGIDNEGGTLTVTDTIIANNTNGDCVGTVTDGGHNLIGDAVNSCGLTNGVNGNIVGVDPMLDPGGLKDNGGPTQTIALQAGSPAINAGDEAICAGPPVNNRDQRGLVRPGTGHTQCSIGAYEADAVPSMVTATPTETSTTITATATPTAKPSCTGDCDDNGVVAINELILGVNIVLAIQPVDACPAFANTEGVVDIAQIIKGVNSALNGCPSLPTPSVTVPASNTPTPTVTPTRTPVNTPTVTATQSGDQFVDNGDGTITDTQTGLIWEKKDQGGGLHDSNTRYPSAGICTDNGEFCQPDAAAATTCNAATGGAMGCAQCSGTATCNTIIGSTTIWDWLNQINVASFAGHSDWRIPTVGRDSGTVQLETIVDTSVSGCGSGVPCVPPAFNTGCVAGCTASGCSCTQAERYWSATSVVGNLPFPSAWGVFFRTGDVTGIDKASAFYVRAVRGGS